MHVLPMGMVLAFVLFTADASSSPSVAATNGEGLRAFSSETELRRFIRKMRQNSGALDGETYAIAPPPPPPPSASPPTMTSPAPLLDNSSAAVGRFPGEQITNVQEAGIDEGGIVKVAGEYLVILRRGRIFTVRPDGNALD